MTLVLEQWFPILGPQMVLDFQNPTPLVLLVRVSGNCGPKTSGDPRMGTTVLENDYVTVSMESPPMVQEKEEKNIIAETMCKLHL